MKLKFLSPHGVNNWTPRGFVLKRTLLCDHAAWWLCSRASQIFIPYLMFILYVISRDGNVLPQPFLWFHIFRELFWLSWCWRCPFLRNINGATTFSFSSSLFVAVRYDSYNILWPPVRHYTFGFNFFNGKGKRQRKKATAHNRIYYASSQHQEWFSLTSFLISCPWHEVGI